MMLRVAVLAYPGSNCIEDTEKALLMFHQVRHELVDWNRPKDLSSFDLIIIPGGFSYGDYLRSGAIAAKDRLTEEILRANEKGRLILGICNGFQILTECKILPGTLIQNPGLKFISDWVDVLPVNQTSIFTQNLPEGFRPKFPLANNDGEYHCDPNTLDDLAAGGQIVFRYGESGLRDLSGKIGGIVNKAGNVLGLMPHPERAVKYWHGSSDGYVFFHGLIQAALSQSRI